MMTSFHWISWFLLSFFLQTYDWVSFDMTKRSVAMGKTTQMDARIFFQKGGEMVTYFTSPSEMFVLNDRDGDVRFYDPAKNRVFKTMNNQMGSQNTVFYYFLNGNTDDLGLSEIGFDLIQSTIEDEVLVSLYEAPQRLRRRFKHAELVSDGTNPIFLGYIGDDGEYIKKIYYYDYYTVGSSNFPLTITEVDYYMADSVITKTTFGRFQFDKASDKEFIEFEIPQDAILLE